MGMTIGIDLGTTNSVTCIKTINVSSIRNSEGEDLTPSCVTAVPNPDLSSFDLVVGRHSRDLLKQYPEQTILSVKRLMGRDFDDAEVQNIINNNGTAYRITTEASEPGSIRISLAGQLQTPEMISGIILSKLIRDGETELQGKISQAVVTVPAYFSDRQKFATRAACDYAGIKLLRLLPEPTAAALSFGIGELGKEEARTIMVFDLGGGTFDISVLSFSGGSFMEITKGGDMWLGGDNIDNYLVNHIFSRAEAAAQCTSITTLIDQLSPADKSRFLVEIKEKAEAAKIELSTQESASVELFGLLRDENNQLIDIDVTVNQTEFAQLIQPIVDRVTEIAKQILHEIRFEPELIDTVLLVGGSSLVPAIQNALKQMFGAEKVKVHPRPMLAIAEGAALMAAKMSGQDADNAEHSFSMMHSTAHDYYLQLAGGKRHLLVARNTPLPIVVEEKLTFSHSTQSLARLRVFNEVEGLLDTVGELWFHKEKNDTVLAKNQEPTELMLRFSVDEDNIITMKAWSLLNEHENIEAQIARGGLAAKLYNDLESTLSSIVAQSTDATVEEDAIALSRCVVTTILSASDPMTGETRVEQKQKAQRQINTLKQCQQCNIAPLAQYKFAVIAQTESATVISKEDNERLIALVERFKLALENLDDSDEFENLDRELTEFYEDVPIVADLARAENAIALLIAYDSIKEAKQIRSQVKIMLNLFGHEDEDAFEDAREQLEDMVDAEVSYYNPSQGRFDRDVHL